MRGGSYITPLDARSTVRALESSVQEGIHGGEGVELEKIVAPEVVDELDVEARLEAVPAAEHREVVEDLPDLLAEVEARVGDAGDGAAEVRDAADGDRGTRARAVAGRPRLMSAGELYAQLVET